MTETKVSITSINEREDLEFVDASLESDLSNCSISISCCCCCCCFG